MMKRIFDFTLAACALAFLWPFMLASMVAIWWQDKHWPLYSPFRAGLHNKPFRMHKLRTMVVGADKNKVDTTSANDTRITALGAGLRRVKFDELPQLFNIICGEMSFVGPRPQIDREVALYTDVEKHLLDARPGITDFSSIVFADLGDIMARHADPNIAYNQLVRPWKSRLALFYIDNRDLRMDIMLIWLTAMCIVSRADALKGVSKLLAQYGAPPELVEIALRQKRLEPTPPPGSDEIVTSRG